jgi:hypothetical protein
MATTIRSLSICLIALFGGVCVAGCGSSSNSTSGSQTVPTASPASPSAAGTTSTSANGPSAGASGASSVDVQRAVATCEKLIQLAPTLPPSVKARVEGICHKAASGGLEGARNAGKEVCVEVIKASGIPGAAKEQTLAACRKAQ